MSKQVDRREIYQQYEAERRQIENDYWKLLYAASEQPDNQAWLDAWDYADKKFCGLVHRYLSLYPDLFEFVKSSPIYWRWMNEQESEPDND